MRNRDVFDFSDYELIWDWVVPEVGGSKEILKRNTQTAKIPISNFIFIYQIFNEHLLFSKN
jgi:hypothetical protein